MRFRLALKYRVERCRESLMPLAQLACAALIGFTTATIGAQSVATPDPGGGRYPAKPIRLIVPTGAGGSTDLVARTVAQKLAETLGQQVVVDNRGGGGGVVGTELAAQAAPDGYTLLIATTGVLAINPHLYRKLSYDPIKDFAPVAQISAGAYMLLVNPSLPATSLQEFVALARAKPGQLAYASAGSGTASHLAMELFLMVAALKVLHVPYRTSGGMVTSLISNETQMMFGGIPLSLPQIKAGRLRVLAVTTANRVSVAPDVPTFAEAGYPRAESTTWIGMLAPAGTPRAVVGRLEMELRRILHSPDVKNRFSSNGAETVGNSPEAFGAYIKAELGKWGKVVSVTGAKVD